jgi:hypothetical protein
MPCIDTLITLGMVIAAIQNRHSGMIIATQNRYMNLHLWHDNCYMKLLDQIHFLA